MAEQLLTVEQAASRLHLQPSTIRRQLRDGALRGIKRGHVWRVPESALYTSSENNSTSVRAEALWRDIISGDNLKRSAAIIALASASDAVREIVQERSGRAATSFYATPEGQAELADWRELDGEPFHGFEDDTDAA